VFFRLPTRFSDIYISQGIVATLLMCGGIFSNHFIANFLQNVRVKEFGKSVYLAKIWTKVGGLLSLTHPV